LFDDEIAGLDNTALFAPDDSPGTLHRYPPAPPAPPLSLPPPPPPAMIRYSAKPIPLTTEKVLVPTAIKL
jgi:hypothetical protein